MGLINKLFGGSSEPKEEKVLPWITLSELEQLDTITEKSSTKTQVIFKHSTRCGISRMVMNQFVSAYNLTENDLDVITNLDNIIEGKQNFTNLQTKKILKCNTNNKIIVKFLVKNPLNLSLNVSKLKLICEFVPKGDYNDIKGK